MHRRSSNVPMLIYVSFLSGSDFGFSAFLNCRFLASGQGISGADTVNTTLSFPSDIVSTGDNVLIVVSDSTGKYRIYQNTPGVYSMLGLDEDWNSNDQFKASGSYFLPRVLTDSDDVYF